jgi:hypothetical protein
VGTAGAPAFDVQQWRSGVSALLIGKSDLSPLQMIFREGEHHER